MNNILINNESIIGIVAAIIALIGILLTLFQLFQTKKIKKAEFVYELLKSIRSNPNIAKVEYMMDYDLPWYGYKFHGSKKEALIDDFLAQLNFICFLKSKRYISKKEIELFEYELNRTITNGECLCYLWNLHHWSKRNDKKCSFAYLIEYAKEQMNESEKEAFDSPDPKISGFKKIL